MSIQFNIESVVKLTSRNKTLVFAKLLNSNLDWKLSENSKLGLVEIENWVDIPRAHDKEGNIRWDLFVFQLKNNNDNDKLKINEIAELTP